MGTHTLPVATSDLYVPSVWDMAPIVQIVNHSTRVQVSRALQRGRWLQALPMGSAVLRELANTYFSRVPLITYWEHQQSQVRRDHSARVTFLTVPTLQVCCGSDMF